MSICDYYQYEEANYSCSYNDRIVMLFCQQDKQHEAPMPWIGIYVAAASLVCSLAMAADVFHGFRHRKLWIPCKFFTLNAASLTLLGVAMKLPVDLSTQMPGNMDQLVKLTGTVLMSTTMDICIQLRTQLIDPFLEREYIAAVSFMLVLLLILSFSALTVSTIRKRLQLNYDDIYKKILSEESEGIQKFKIVNLKEDVKKYWIMTETGSLQFVIARSVTCYVSGTICFLAAFTLAEANVRMWTRGYQLYMHYMYVVGSCYRWSIFVVFVIQSFGVVVGTIAVAFRWFAVIRLRCSVKRVKSYRTELNIENYWIEKLVGWREKPLALRIWGQKCRKLVHSTKNLILNFFIRVQITIVMASKLILLIPIFLVSTLMSFGLYYKVLKQKLRYCKPTTSNNHREPESGPGTTLDLSRYVIYLEGEEELPLQIMKNNRDATNHFIQKGKKQQPKYLKELLDQSTAFMGVEKFDSDRVPFLNSEEPPNCWSLPVITLTSIAIALPNNENQKVNWLRRSVREGLLYVNLVEKILDAKGDLVSIKNTADIVWFGVDLFGKWLDEDLRKIALERKTSKETLERLLDISKNIVMEFKANMNGKENPLKWPMKVIAANSMYRISQTLLLDQEGSKDQMDHERLFDQLSVMVADILGACLTNMPRVITTKCFCSAIEEREKNVQHAAHLLGETEEILEILQQRELPSLNPDQAADINEWRASMKKKDPSAFTSSSNSGSSSSGSCQLHIAIE
ncbi:uncharacterized protein LOC132304038 isoform X2 [Cornus florida]|uniref:uncharacterized protein LOC132304038 isoform X2 n=1 Tax=Cornus florida TaxID=4283 RepID=UPI002897D967|nr:uncharacterized protein LOC132304038 isoform X2 [Cornus florida]